MDWLSNQFGFSTDTQVKLVASAIVVIGLLLTRWLVLRSIQQRFEETWVSYRARKVATYTATVFGIAALAYIWIDAFNDLATFLGLLSAGIAIALADVLKNMAGWVYILARRPFRVGDRVEIDGSKGDVVDIRLFRFSLMEVGKWVQAEQSTGRLIHVPNGLLFTQQVANYTEGFPYIWSEIPILITFESDRRLARRLIEQAVAERVPDLEKSAGDQIRKTAHTYHLKIGALTPITYLEVKDSGVQLTCRFLVPVRQQRHVLEEVWDAVLDRFDEAPEVELAYPTVRTFFSGPIRLEREVPDPRRG